MKTKTNDPTTTKKYHIEVPTHQYLSVPTLFKVYFGSKYLIWKGKSLLQSCQFIAEGIERYLRLNKNDDTDYLYYVAAHVKRTRCIKASVEVIANDYVRKDSDAIDGFKMLKEEQILLDKAAKDPDCLNNNAESYVPGWINKAHVERFEKYLRERKKRKK